jgi:hypothetical protein
VRKLRCEGRPSEAAAHDEDAARALIEQHLLAALGGGPAVEMLEQRPGG